MKFSYNWLRDLVPGMKLTPQELTAQITMKTAECEGVEPFAPWLDQVVAARIVEVQPIEGSKNVRAVVDAGPKYGRKQVICGAPNCRAGIVTAYVPAGTTIEGGKEIRKTAIGGVESDGMLAAGGELGLNRDHDAILELDPSTSAGAPLPGIGPDWIIEVDNKSLTHRPDLWGHLGMAREVAAVAGLRQKDPVDLSLLPKSEPGWRVKIEEPALCPRYSALVFENVTVGPSPLWLQAKLEALEMNPISNIVDVTNYVMAELAEPMHAFDADKLHGDTIFVRRARNAEKFDALNGESYTLTPSNLVIADAQGAVALGGVIGGAGSAIGPDTKRIILESANFDAACIRKTSSALKLRTDASMRFEKAQDPVNTARALSRAVALFREVSPGIRLAGGFVDQWFPAPEPAPIELPLEWLVRKLGRDISAQEVRDILESLEFRVEESMPGVFLVRVPSWRATKDVSIKDDLLEEVGRIVGYATVPPKAPLQPVEHPWVNEERLLHHTVREACAAQGFTESYNYSFISDDMARRFGFDPEKHLRVANPISVEQALMRTSLLPGIHKNIGDNARYFPEFRIFEIGNEIHPRGGGDLPNEVAHLIAAVYAKGDGHAPFFELKRLAELLLPDCEAKPVASTQSYEHPARAAEIVWRETAVGRIYELHPTLVEAGRATILDIDLKKVYELGPVPKRYVPLRRFPSSDFDLSVVTGLHELAGIVRDRIRAAAGEGCDKVVYLYAYRGKPLADDQQSMTFRITVSAPDRTLSNDDITAIRSRIIAALEAAGYTLRA